MEVVLAGSPRGCFGSLADDDNLAQALEYFVNLHGEILMWLINMELIAGALCFGPAKTLRHWSAAVCVQCVASKVLGYVIQGSD